MFIGDSLTRYQYLNLIYYLEHGVWVANSTLKNENENTFDAFSAGWNQFFQVTNERMGGHEICDCFREHGKNIFEHRYFDDGEIRVTYRQVFGLGTRLLLHPTNLLNVSSCEMRTCTQGLCQPGTCSDEVKPLIDLGTVLQPGAIQFLGETHPASLIFFNAGRWWVDGDRNTFTDHRDVLLGEIRKIRSARPGLGVHWKMTTATRKPLQPEFAFANEIVASGAFDGVYDTHSLTAAIAREPDHLMWDNAHFEPRIYEGLNRALIAYICSLPPRT